MTVLKPLALIAGIAISASASNAGPLATWTNGTVLPNGDAGMLYMGALGGFGAAFDLDLKMEALKGDPLLLKAVIAGQIDSYIGGPGSPMIAASKGADIRIIGCGWTKQNYILWGNASVQTLADLRGKKVGISSPGSAPDLFIRAAADGGGVPVDSIAFVAAGMPPELLTQTSAGVIDATATPGEYMARAQAMGLHAITTSAQATPLAMQRCYFARAATLRDKADLVVRFLATEMAAYRFSLTHRSETIALTRTVVQSKPDAPEPIAGYDLAVDNNVIDVSFEPPLDKLRWLRDTLVKSGQISAGWDPEQMIERGPLAKARALVAAQRSVANAEAPAGFTEAVASAR